MLIYVIVATPTRCHTRPVFAFIFLYFYIRRFDAACYDAVGFDADAAAATPCCHFAAGVLLFR